MPPPGQIWVPVRDRGTEQIMTGVLSVSQVSAQSTLIEGLLRMLEAIWGQVNQESRLSLSPRARGKINLVQVQRIAVDSQRTNGIE